MYNILHFLSLVYISNFKSLFLEEAGLEKLAEAVRATIIAETRTEHYHALK